MNGVRPVQAEARTRRGVVRQMAGALRKQPDGCFRRTVAEAVAARHIGRREIQLQQRAALRFGSAPAVCHTTPLLVRASAEIQCAVPERADWE